MNLSLAQAADELAARMKESTYPKGEEHTAEGNCNGVKGNDSDGVEAEECELRLHV